MFFKKFEIYFSTVIIFTLQNGLIRALVLDTQVFKNLNMKYIYTYIYILYIKFFLVGNYYEKKSHVSTSIRKINEIAQIKKKLKKIQC